MTAKTIDIITRDVQRDVDQAQTAVGVPQSKRALVAPEAVEAILNTIEQNDEALDFLSKM